MRKGIKRRQGSADVSPMIGQPMPRRPRWGLHPLAASFFFHVLSTRLPAPQAVLVASAPLPDGTPIIKGWDFNDGASLDGIMAAMLTTGCQATALGQAVNEVNRMVSERGEREIEKKTARGRLRRDGVGGGRAQQGLTHAHHAHTPPIAPRCSSPGTSPTSRPPRPDRPTRPHGRPSTPRSSWPSPPTWRPRGRGRPCAGWWSTAWWT